MSEPRESESCEGCHFYQSLHPKTDRGECRRYPPTIIEREVAKSMEGDLLSAIYQGSWWPLVEVGEWCGEYQPE